ncbi:MAG: hypothetical protein EPO21_02235 [Chloroflexota bacterium]|nr:MAG: hypothetical protein EPO21_02235 [Chloroflexota bacterium]
MIQRFDHAVIAVRDLEEASCSYTDYLGLPVKAGGTHPGAGTHNSIMRFGLDYLELLAVRDREEAVQGWLRGGPLLSFLSARQGLTSFVLASDDIEADTARAAGAGVQTVGPFPMRRQRPDGNVFSWRLTFLGEHPWRQPVPFLIQYDQPDAERLQWDPPTSTPLGVTRVAAIAVAVRNLGAAMHLYENALGLQAAHMEDVPALGARQATIPLGTCTVRLLAPIHEDGLIGRELAERGEGPFEIALAVRSMEKAKGLLRERGTEFEPAPGSVNRVLIDPSRACGARIVLVKETAG